VKFWVVTIASGLAILCLSISLAFIPMPWANSAWFRMLPYVFFSIGGTLGLLFTQSRVTYLCSLYVAILALLSTYSLHPDPTRLAVTVFLASIYLPPLTVLLYYLSERRIVSLHGFLRLLVIMSVVAAVAFFPSSRALCEAISNAHNTLFMPPLDCCRLPLVGILVFIGAVPFLIATRKSESLSGLSLIPSLFFTFGALNFQSSFWQDSRIALPAFMSAAALSLIAAVLQSSWHSMHTDELTELPGRRSLRQHIANLRPPYSIALLDVDFFKKINDKYGHATGDEVLRYISSHLRQLTIGRAYRYGGEEFVVVMEGGKDGKSCVAAMEALRETISGRDFWVRGKDRPRRRPEQIPDSVKHPSSPKIVITVSIGIAHSKERYNSPSEVLDAADKAMYRAKQDGRDRVKVAR
jgi:diguanylate cyclase (GGDEF)-like protein